MSSSAELQVLAVGKPFEPGLTSFNVGGYFVPTFSGMLFAIALDGVTAREQRAFDREDAEFALHAAGSVAVLLYRFGAGIPWSDACFNVLNGGRMDAATVSHLSGLRVDDRDRLLLSLALIEARTGVVCGLRALTLSPAFSSTLLEILQKQIAHGPVSDSEFRREVGSLYARYPTVKSILADSIARTIGGY
jgi:hypothetical protein